MDINFKTFFENTDFISDVKDTLKKIPKSHADLVKDYKFACEKGNTLKNDNKHVGEIDEKTNKIKVAGSWRFPREFTFLHEVAHAVYKYKVTSELKKEWSELIKKIKPQLIKNNKENKESINQNDEELFCHSYANFYSNHKNKTYDNEQLHNFIENLPN